MSSLFKIDTMFGHVVEETPEGLVYQDDRSPVTKETVRPCLGCNAVCGKGHDPCIANLPGTRHACCGHGRDTTPVSNSPAGYVALEDGRRITFSGLVGGERIRAAVTALLAGDPLPEGFTLDENPMWWAGLSQKQRAYVEKNTPRGLAKLVREAGAKPSKAFLKGKAMWWDGLNDEQKAYVWANLKRMLDELVSEALASC